MIAGEKMNAAKWEGFNVLDQHIEERLFDWIASQTGGIEVNEGCCKCGHLGKSNVQMVVIKEDTAEMFLGYALPMDCGYEMTLSRRECLICSRVDIEGELYLYM